MGNKSGTVPCTNALKILMCCGILTFVLGVLNFMCALFLQQHPKQGNNTSFSRFFSANLFLVGSSQNFFTFLRLFLRLASLFGGLCFIHFGATSKSYYYYYYYYYYHYYY